MAFKTSGKQGVSQSSQELEAQLVRVLKQTLKAHADKNIPVVYRDSHCIAKNQFVHLYPNGKKFLISQNHANSKETILREL